MRLVDKVDGVATANLDVPPGWLDGRRRPSRRSSPVSSSSIRRTATCWPTWRLDRTGRGVWRSIRAAPSWPWPTAAPPVRPRSGVSRFPAAAPAGAFSGPAGSYEQLSYHPDGRWLGAVRLDDDGLEREIVVWAVDSPDAPISLGPGTAYGFLPGTTSVVIAGGDDQGSLSVVDLETGDVVRSIETPDIEVDRGSPSIRPATAWRCCRRQESGSWSSISTAASRSRLRRHRLRSRPSSAPTGRWLAIG